MPPPPQPTDAIYCGSTRQTEPTPIRGCASIQAGLGWPPGPCAQVPKAFKIIPSLTNWEEVLFLTEPDSWTPHAVYQATRMFVSNLNQKMVRPASPGGGVEGVGGEEV
jgi:hypothetical protein